MHMGTFLLGPFVQTTVQECGCCPCMFTVVCVCTLEIAHRLWALGAPLVLQVVTSAAVPAMRASPLTCALSMPLWPALRCPTEFVPHGGLAPMTPSLIPKDQQLTSAPLPRFFIPPSLAKCSYDDILHPTDWLYGVQVRFDNDTTQTMLAQLMNFPLELLSQLVEQQWQLAVANIHPGQPKCISGYPCISVAMQRNQVGPRVLLHNSASPGGGGV